MKNAGVLIVFVCVMAAVNFASANTIRGIDIDFVTIGNAGNTADTGGTVGCGAVGYNYRIGKYEVTNTQWNTFTAAIGAPTGYDGGYSYSAGFTGVQQPTNNVSWHEAAQFCNYLTSGDKSKGAYQFSGDNTNPGNFLGIDRASSISTYGTTYVIPTEDEWYKAAYFKSDASGYSLYANGTDIAPTDVQSNYGHDDDTLWNVGTGTQEQNGTSDMMGNAWEWNETLFDSSYRILRGGACSHDDNYLNSLHRYDEDDNYPYYEDVIVGFRVAEIPEPATICLLGIGALSLIRRKK
ncbi:MAG: SUMF1/EgtB/PvdO family nonheme iron enzyme [Sedimentisphaerales bacterium]